MAQDVLNLQEESFERIIKALSINSPTIKEHFDRAVEKITALSGEWNDEDYQNLLNALNGLKTKLNDLDDNTQQMIAKAEYSLEMIRSRPQYNK